MPLKKIVFGTIIVFLFAGCSHLPWNSQKTKGTESAAGNVEKNVGQEKSTDPYDLLRKDSTGTTTPQEAAGQQSALSEADINQENDSLSLAQSSAVSGSGENSQPETDEVENKQDQTSLDEALDFCEVAQSYWQKGELENALEALDKAYSLILEVETKEDAKLIQQKEDLRYLISKRILEIYASRNIVVNGNHHEIPLEMNRHVEAELQRFNNGERNFLIESYKRSGMYRPYILAALKKAGLPEELSWLPLIESGFKVKAFSRARALGLWQFIPSTGYKFGLKRNRYIDERIDFIKSTDAAIAYLKELHSIFDSIHTFN